VRGKSYFQSKTQGPPL